MLVVSFWFLRWVLEQEVNPRTDPNSLFPGKLLTKIQQIGQYLTHLSACSWTILVCRKNELLSFLPSVLSYFLDSCGSLQGCTKSYQWFPPMLTLLKYTFPVQHHSLNSCHRFPDGIQNISSPSLSNPNQKGSLSKTNGNSLFQLQVGGIFPGLSSSLRTPDCLFSCNNCLLALLKYLF